MRSNSGSTNRPNQRTTALVTHKMLIRIIFYELIYLAVYFNMLTKTDACCKKLILFCFIEMRIRLEQSQI